MAIECYIRLFQSYCSTHYGSILWPLHDRGFNDFCVTWNKGVRRMLNISNMTHTALLGQLINTCHISIQLVKRFCKFVDLMLTSHNAVVRHFVRRAISGLDIGYVPAGPDAFFRWSGQFGPQQFFFFFFFFFFF